MGSSAEPPYGSERTAWVDIARTLAILLIVGFHAAYEISPDPALRPAGFVGTSLFFIISGFLLSSKYSGLTAGENRGNGWTGWLKRRYLRIASVYYPALILMVLLFGAQTYYRGFYDLLLHMFFLQWVSHSTEFSIIASAWFLTPLLALYAVYPLLNGWIRKAPWLGAALIAAATLYRVWSGEWVSASPVFFAGDFIFGMMMAQGRKEAWAGVLGAVLKPILIAPYLVLEGLRKSSRWTQPAGAVFRPIGVHTFEIFLFHEAFLMVLLGKWSVAGLGTDGSLVILGAGVAAATFLPGFLSKRFRAS